MDAEKNKKLQQYATILTDQAKEAEQSGKSDDAIKHYLKLVDVFLVLASEAADHNTWLQYIRQAEAYQTRIRSLVPKDQGSQDLIGRIPPPPNERTNPLIVRKMDPVSQQTTSPPTNPVSDESSEVKSNHKNSQAFPESRGRSRSDYKLSGEANDSNTCSIPDHAITGISARSSKTIGGSSRGKKSCTARALRASAVRK